MDIFILTSPPNMLTFTNAHIIGTWDRLICSDFARFDLQMKQKNQIGTVR